MQYKNKQATKTKSSLLLQKAVMDNDEKERKDIRKRFVILCIVVFTLFSGYGVVVVLQSSINIEGGTGIYLFILIPLFIYFDYDSGK